MRPLILSILSILTLLIYPLSLSAQNSFSLSVDLNSAAGDQAVTSLNTAPNQVVAIAIFGTDIRNANGLAVRFEYDASQVAYEGFDVGNVLPNAQALPSQGTNPTYVEIGMASLGGQATANSGLLGTIRFRTIGAFTSTAIQLVRAELGRGGRFETIMPNISIALQGAPPPPNFTLSLDVDGSAGDQAVTSLNTAPNQVVAIAIFGTDIRNANGLAVRFEYDASQVVYEGFDVGNVLPNAQALPSQGTNPTYVEIGMASLGGQATANSGLLGTIRFRTTGAFTSTAMIRLVRAELGRGGQIESVTMDVRVALQLSVSTPPSPDFNGDGIVNIADLVLFVDFYGTKRGDGKYEAKYDLDSDGEIGISDLRVFVNDFLEPAPLPLPDLIVESPSVSNSTLTVGQPFTLQATVRNQGSGQSVATTLRYYQSVNATISSSDTRVGSAAVGSLTASSSSVESISLNAPSSAGTYYYGACVASVSGESDTGNNCSPAVRVTVSSGTNVDIPDANLRAVIRETLGKASGAPITRSEMASLARLDARNSNISDLTGLEFATGLTQLDLGDKRVDGERINSNEISDLSPLSSLTNLTSLDLEGNSISDLSPLSGLTNLGTLWLPNNSISDISPIVNLTKIWQISLSSNLISNISPLANLTKVEWLSLSDNLISDISALAGLTELQGLWLSSNNISVVSPLSGLTNLTSDLSLSDNLISDVSALSNLTNLTRLDLGGNSISDVSALSNLTNLTELSLSDNLISDVSALSGLTDLTWLWLFSNAISDVSALSGLTNLTRLDIGRNSISDISALSGLTNLTRLDIEENLISDVSALSRLTNLTFLLLFTNSISDLAPLVANTGLGSGDEVDVRDNPLSVTSLNTHIPALQGRGVTVQFGAGKPAVVEEKEPRMPYPENVDIVNGGRP